MIRLFQWLFDRGREHQRLVEQRAQEDAFDSGYAQGYQDGQRDAGAIEVELDLSDLVDEDLAELT